MDISVEHHVPPPSKEGRMSQMELLEKTRAIATACELLAMHGMEFDDPDEGDKEKAAGIAITAARDPDDAARHLTPQRIAQAGPMAMVLTNSILQEFGTKVVHDAERLRNMVTNKLIIETESPEANIRLRALGLLGKFSDVGLFTERREVTVTHQTTDDLRSSLRAKLERLRDITPVEDVEFEEDTTDAE